MDTAAAKTPEVSSKHTRKSKKRKRQRVAHTHAGAEPAHATQASAKRVRTSKQQPNEGTGAEAAATKIQELEAKIQSGPRHVNELGSLLSLAEVSDLHCTCTPLSEAAACSVCVRRC